MGAKREPRLDWTDETAIAMGGNGGLAIEEKGAKEVCSASEEKLKQHLQMPISSTGREETNVAVMLTAASDGTPLKPPFKTTYRELYDNWIVRGNREETAEGNLRRLRMRVPLVDCG
ncbi:hypothetical protein AAVH_31407, partial [Aphelenchoides avenae]